MARRPARSPHDPDPFPATSATRPARRIRRWRRCLLLLLAVAGLLSIASPAAAHLDVVSTDPADGGVLADPAAGITLTFNRTGTPSGSGITLFDARGERVPATVATPDGGRTWRLRPGAPLPPGPYGVRWQVTAGDAHPRTGTVRFRVADAGRPPAVGSGEQSRPSATASPGHGTGHEPGAGPGPHADMPGHGAAPGQGPDALTAALAADTSASSAPWDLLGTAARWVCFAGILVAVGALAVVLSTLVGSEGDVRLSERVVRTAAALAAAGALVEGVCLLLALGSGVPWQPATAVVLRVLAGAGLALTLRLVPRSTGGRRSRDVPALPTAIAHPISGGSPAGARTAHLVLTPPVRTGRVRGVAARPVAAATLSLVLLASFLFDGHTAIVGPWPVVAAAALAHTAAVAVWVGGVVLLATLLLARARAGVPTGAGELAVRFSVPATAAVVAAGIAGVALTMLIIETPADLVTTAWGRVLLVKVGLVAVVALMGYANNRYALPALDAWRPGTARLLRRAVAAEAAVMLTVLLVTAVLVASQA